MASSKLREFRDQGVLIQDNQEELVSRVVRELHIHDKDQVGIVTRGLQKYFELDSDRSRRNYCVVNGGALAIAEGR